MDAVITMDVLFLDRSLKKSNSQIMRLGYHGTFPLFHASRLMNIQGLPFGSGAQGKGENENGRY